LSLKGEADRECHAVEATEGDGSAGNRAFRATGNEPGWLAVVDGDTPGLQVEVDYGERRFDVAQPQVLTAGVARRPMAPTSSSASSAPPARTT
jgi:hypothetical protein